jgi:Ca2+-binding RTX toxin-like protein
MTTIVSGLTNAPQTVFAGTMIVTSTGIVAPLGAFDNAVTLGAGASLIVQGIVTNDATDSSTAAVISSADLGASEVRVQEGGLVEGTNGIVLFRSGSSVANSGTVDAALVGVALFGDSASVTNAGTITGTAGVRMGGADSYLQNTGTIQGIVDPSAAFSVLEAAGVAIRDGRVENHGIISSASSVGLLMDGLELGQVSNVSILNTGTISGKVDAVVARGQADDGTDVRVELVNQGLIKGNVVLNNQDDVYDGREGKLVGELSMGGGNDAAQGGRGADLMSGGNGNDALRGHEGDDGLKGDAGLDTLHGGDGADSIGGGADGDEMYGEAGNDLLLGDAGADTVDGGLGNDTILAGIGDDEVEAGEGNDVVYGDEGADLLDGGLGLDTLSYSLSNAAMKVNLATGDASGGVAQGDEISGFERLVGSGFNDTLTGSAASDTIQGGEGNDVIVGGTGADQLRGGAGNDTIEGGGGRDVLFGGAGADLFRFRALSDSTPAARDVIRDFEQAGDMDRINLTQIDANTGVAGDQTFALLGPASLAAIGAGQLRWSNVDGDTLLQGYVNNDAVADFSILLTGTMSLVAGDFIL